MTSRDKTGDKLVASIRKTKQGTTPAASAESGPAAPAKARPTAATKTRQRTRARPKAASGTKTKTVAGTGKTPPVDNYRMGRRVWPD